MKGANTRLRTGRRAEDLAASSLESHGMKIVARNWRRPEGELDLVVEDRGVCVFVEVRSRTGDQQGHPLESVNRRKRAQIIRTARLYLQEAAPAATGYRFDVVGVVFAEDGRPLSCLYVQDAFRLED